MNRFVYISAMALMLGSFSSCSHRSGKQGGDTNDSVARTSAQEDILVGTLNVAVDASVFPLMQEQEEVFLSAYPNAKLNFMVKPEVLAIKDLVEDKATVAILARELTAEENKNFASRSITPRIFPVWHDAIVFVSSKHAADTSVTVADVFAIMKGDSPSGKKLLFDNLNSSSFRQLKSLGQLDKVASTFVEGANTAKEVLETIAHTPGKIGVISYNEYLNLELSFSNNIRILSVKNTIGDKPDNIYYKPTQSTIAAEQYPLRRTFYVLNYQSNLGLGIGFSAFLTGDRGQRIVLKSGLVPATMPGREIIVRDEI